MRQRLLIIMGLWLLGLATALSGCSTLPAHIDTGQQPATATPIPQVTMRMAAQQSGTIAAQNAVLVVSVTMSNHTNQPISLHGSCMREPIIVSLGGEILTGIPNCVLNSEFDQPPPTAPDSSHTYTLRIPLSGPGAIGPNNAPWQPGTYTLKVTVPDWHQDPNGPATGSLTQEMSFILS